MKVIKKFNLNVSNKTLNNIYIGIIALHGSYNLLNFEEFSTNKENIIEKIYNLISFVDPKIQSYYGLRLEILFLLSLIENNNINNENTIKLYNEIQESNTITTSLKERVAKVKQIYSEVLQFIYDFLSSSSPASTKRT